MPITNNTPFAFHLLAGQAHPPHRSATLILKGTFDIVPDGTCVPAGKQRPIEGDRQHMDEIGRGPAWASDLVEFKPHTDFYILGSFHQPDGVAAPTGTGGFTLGPLSKDLAFFGPRIAVRGPDQVWTATPPEPFVSLPLRWEYSFGGLSDRRNPMGMGIDQVRSADGPPTVLLPRIEDPAHPLRSLKDRPPPANFAPVPATFLDRRRKLGTRDKHWSVFRAPLPPEDYDPSHANAAPHDQQAGNYPVGDETLTLRNLHPKQPTLTTRLPALRIDAGVLRQTRSGLKGEVVTMNLDTIVALPEVNQIVLIWRGVLNATQPVATQEFPHIRIEMAPLDTPAPRPNLPDRMLAELAERAAETKRKDAAEIAQTLGQVRKMVAGLKLPPALGKVLATESDPEVMYKALDTHLTTTIADLLKKYPDAAAKIPKL